MNDMNDLPAIFNEHTHTPDGLPPLREIVARYDLAPKKSLGQNFLFDFNLTLKIAKAAGDLRHVDVVEVGAGPGGLTRALLHAGARHVYAIERDARCLAALEEIAIHYKGRLTLIEGDALSLDWQALASRAQNPIQICANLPYNIGTPLLVQWLSSEPWPPFFQRLTLMFQKEVAERIIATPQSRKDYGRLAVLCGARCDSHALFDVPASAFVPPPKIISTVVDITPRALATPVNMASLELVTRAAFGNRRKMLRQALKSLDLSQNAHTPLTLEQLFAQAEINPQHRAEDLSVTQFVRLASLLNT